MVVEEASGDHPRSRGVYKPEDRLAMRQRGSSPLARGLHAATLDLITCARIIPARAGFTRTPWRERPPFSDHPRSRGVYTWAAAPSCPTYGSSPLARGLRSAHRGVALPDRIIPARAGFTRLVSRRPQQLADHPRSRGVYVDWPSQAAAEVGSSPLARGLHVISSLERKRNRDHPRSRGVYFVWSKGLVTFMGSSPLARGLLPISIWDVI